MQENSIALRRADPHSQPWNYCAQTGHEGKINNAKIVIRTNKKGDRLIIQAFHSFNGLVESDKQYAILTRSTMQNVDTNRRTVHQNGGN